MTREITIPKSVLEDLMKAVDNETFAKNYLKILKGIYDERDETRTKLNHLEAKIEAIYRELKRLDISINAIDITPIEDLDLSVRAYNCLKRANINTMSEIVLHKTDIETGKIRNLGMNSRKELLKLIETYQSHKEKVNE